MLIRTEQICRRIFPKVARTDNLLFLLFSVLGPPRYSDKKHPPRYSVCGLCAQQEAAPCLYPLMHNLYICKKVPYEQNNYLHSIQELEAYTRRIPYNMKENLLKVILILLVIICSGPEAKIFIQDIWRKNVSILTEVFKKRLVFKFLINLQKILN